MSSRIRKAALAAVAAAVLAGCGGGGSDESSYFAVSGQKTASPYGLPNYTVCVDDSGFIDPNTAAGKAMAQRIAAHYGLTGELWVASGTQETCASKYPRANVVIDIDAYRRVIEAAPAPLSCGETTGPGMDGITLSGVGSYANLSRAAGRTGLTVSLDPGVVAYSIATQPATATTGPLRVSLMAVGASFQGGSLTGYVLARAPLVFTGGTSRLINGQRVDLSTSSVTLDTPPAGNYCIVLLLEEQDAAACSRADGYCHVDWLQFAGAVRFE